MKKKLKNNIPVAQDTDKSRATVVVDEPVAAAAIDAIIAATDVAVAAVVLLSLFKLSMSLGLSCWHGACGQSHALVTRKQIM